MKNQNNKNNGILYKSLLEMNNNETLNFFLKGDSYCNIELPNYFEFNRLLSSVKIFVFENNFSLLQGKKLTKSANEIKKKESVNYTICSNKNGRFEWRPFEIIHPILYVDLVRKITIPEYWMVLQKRFKKFQENKKIECLSIPVKSVNNRSNKSSQILKWWLDIEQRSIELSLEYNYLFHTDISNCYPSIYTHSIAWAIDEKELAKKKRHDLDLLGNIIDVYIQLMRNGQTNGIPQGSVLADFIAEIILGYADLELSKSLNKIKDYKILRYRDDYRIFVNNPEDGEIILKSLTEVLLSLNLTLNTKKTTDSKHIINNSLKADKYEWILKKNEDKDIQKNLLIIHSHGIQFPNAGSLVTALTSCYRRLYKTEVNNIKYPNVLISIVADIAYNNPRTIPVCVAIISKLICMLEKDMQKEIIEVIHKKFLQLPNMGLVEIWLQRLSLPLNINIKYYEKLCRLVDGEDVSIWDIEWMDNVLIDNLKKLMKQDINEMIIKKDLLKKSKPLLRPAEVDIFKAYNY